MGFIWVYAFFGKEPPGASVSQTFCGVEPPRETNSGVGWCKSGMFPGGGGGGFRRSPGFLRGRTTEKRPMTPSRSVWVYPFSWKEPPGFHRGSSGIFCGFTKQNVQMVGHETQEPPEILGFHQALCGVEPQRWHILAGLHRGFVQGFHRFTGTCGGFRSFTVGFLPSPGKSILPRSGGLWVHLSLCLVLE